MPKKHQTLAKMRKILIPMIEMSIDFRFFLRYNKRERPIPLTFRAPKKYRKDVSL